MSEELKNCPFCGGEATLCDDGKEWFYIVCGDCGVVTDHVSAREIAVRIWNTRPEEDRLKAENERLKEALRQIVEIANRRATFTVKTLKKYGWYDLAKIASNALADAPDNNVGTKGRKDR